MLRAGIRKGLAQAWLWLLSTAALLILIALGIAVFGYMPGVENMEQVLNITLSLVGVSLVLFLLASVAGFARDIEQGVQTALVYRSRQVAYQ